MPTVTGGRATETIATERLARLAREAVDRLRLDLRGAVVLTEAATGAYAVTPVLAALAGAAEVHAVTRDSRHGAVADVVDETHRLAERLGVRSSITITTDRSDELFRRADVVTNSGHLRPIDAATVAAMRPGAVLPLMFEAWELGAGRTDLDLGALQARGVEVAGTNERHPDIAVFGYLGLLAAVQLADAGVSAHLGQLALWCDNPFLEPMAHGLRGAGATVRSADTLGELLAGPRPDALVVAMRPRDTAVIDGPVAALVAEAWPGVTVTQFWGDIDRAACEGLRVWPEQPPAKGHMGVLLSRLGPEPVVRLQAGGLKVAQVLRIPSRRRTRDDLDYLT